MIVPQFLIEANIPRRYPGKKAKIRRVFKMAACWTDVSRRTAKSVAIRGIGLKNFHPFGKQNNCFPVWNQRASVYGINDSGKMTSDIEISRKDVVEDIQSLLTGRESGVDGHRKHFSLLINHSYFDFGSKRKLKYAKEGMEI